MTMVEQSRNPSSTTSNKDPTKMAVKSDGTQELEQPHQ